VADYSLLISDLHLSAAEPELSAGFKRYCREIASDASALYILGDLSDAWIGDDDQDETASLIRDELTLLVNNGTAVFLMSGNRDFLMGQQLAKDCGLTLLDDPSIKQIHGHKVLLTHGDTYCTDDSEYMTFRAQIQSPATKQMLMMKSLDERRVIASQLRSQSKSANASKASDIMDVNDGVVRQAFVEHSVNTMIHGHTHRPDTHEYSLAIDGVDIEGTRYVLGDWQPLEAGVKGWHITLDNQSVELDSFYL